MPAENEVVTLLNLKKIRLTVMFDTVSIQLVCSGEYEAQVLFDDLKERLEAGQEISIDPNDVDGEGGKK